jgi:hypothetical protein
MYDEESSSWLQVDKSTLFLLNDGKIQFSELFTHSLNNTVKAYSPHLTYMFNKRKYEWHTNLHARQITNDEKMRIKENWLSVT